MFWLGFTIGCFISSIVVFIIVGVIAGGKITELRAKIYKQQEYICCNCRKVPFECGKCEYNYLKDDN